MKYNPLDTRTKNKWQKIGTHKRSGVVVPLFSVYSKQSTGIGEIPDIKYIVDWCKLTGMSIIQLLPLNELGPDHAPYNAISTFALEPAYLRLNELIGIDIIKLVDEIKTLRQKFKLDRGRVDYAVKSEKLRILWKIFCDSFVKENNDYRKFIEYNDYWLREYALFKIISGSEGTSEWDKWERKLSSHDEDALERIFSENSNEVDFYYWLQWQLYEQLKDARKYANDNGVLLMGDLPFLVSRWSADVWSHQDYFKMNLAAGAPPDMYFANGQLWGMPPYNWGTIEKDNYVYLKQRLQYAENFYNLYRIDHFIGLFRIWTVELTNNKETGALRRNFDPENEDLWEKHGKKIIDKMLSFSYMLPCAEDLGTVPECSYKTLSEYGIPGVDFQRFLKDRNDNFIRPENYRPNSSAVTSTHDSTFFANWWKYEAGTVDGKLFDRLCRSRNIKVKKLKSIKRRLFDKKRSSHGRLFWKENVSSVSILIKIPGLQSDEAGDIISLYKSSYGEHNKFMFYLSGKLNRKVSPATPSFVKKSLERINESNSIFSIQLIHEFLSLDKTLFNKINKWNCRINSPGTFSDKNWSIRLPISVDKLSDLKINNLIHDMNKRSGRIN